MDALNAFSEAERSVAPLMSESDFVGSIQERTNRLTDLQNRRNHFHHSFIGSLSWLIEQIPGGREAWDKAIENAVKNTNRVYEEAR